MPVSSYMCPPELLAAHHEWVSATFGIDPRSYQPPAAARGKAGSPVLDAGRDALQRLGKMWADEEAKIETGIDALRSDIAKLYDGDDAAPEVDKAFQGHVDSVMKNFDGSFVKLIAAGTRCQTADEMGKVKAALRDKIHQYMDIIANDPAIAIFDENPMTKLDIAASCVGTLDEMLALLRPA